jgi:cobaltochelatase CobT
MGDAQARARQQQKVEELCGAAIRALSGESGLHFRGRRLHRGATALPRFAAHLHPALEHDDFASFRGAADGLALRLRDSDAALHRRLAPKEPVERMVFDLLEQLRVESRVPETLPGAARNIEHRHRAWALAFHDAGLTESTRGILLYTVAQVCRARVTAQPVLEPIAGVIEHTRAALAVPLGEHLAGLRRERGCQAAYARHALAIARFVGAALHALDAQEEGGADAAAEEADATRDAFRLLLELDGDEATALPVAPSGPSRVLEEAGDGYRVFTTAYDREVEAAALVRPALLQEYRERLDRRVAGQGVHLARLARQLKALLAEPSRDGWEGGQDSGQVDGRRLAQLVSSPTERRLFRIERQEPAADCVVGFLVDCSGSMKEHAESVAMLVDVFARALEMAGVASEVLGFTTGAWNGGRAQRDWRRAGRPAHPGRLNEVCHLVFKDADTTWRRGRRGIAALLRAELFREGIDGEAVEWACRRLEARAERRRLLLVVSDGCPMDTATHLANDFHYLDQHLREVVARREREGSVAIHGVGVGLDLSPYYPRSQALDLAASSGNEVFRDVLALLAGRGRR